MFGQVAFAKFGVGRDETLPDEGSVPIALDDFAAPFQSGGGCRQGWNGGWGIGDGSHGFPLHRFQGVKEHLALVGEQPEERSLVHAGAGGDLRSGGLLEALGGVQLQRGLGKTAARIRLPSPHGRHSKLIAVTAISCYVDSSHCYEGDLP